MNHCSHIKIRAAPFAAYIHFWLICYRDDRVFQRARVYVVCEVMNLFRTH